MASCVVRSHVAGSTTARSGLRRGAAVSRAAGSAEGTARSRRDPELRPATEAVVELQAPQLARLASHSVTLSPVRIAGSLVGVMIVAHLDSASAAAEERHLATVSGWLRTAVEQHLASQSAGADRLGALNQALRAAAFDGSDRRLVAVFAEALAVWHDIEVVGYVETAPGVFTRAVSLAGRGRTGRRWYFHPRPCPHRSSLTRMPQTHVDGADRSGAADALVVTFTRSAGPSGC